MYFISLLKHFLQQKKSQTYKIKKIENHCLRFGQNFTFEVHLAITKLYIRHTTVSTIVFQNFLYTHAGNFLTWRGIFKHPSNNFINNIIILFHPLDEGWMQRLSTFFDHVSVSLLGDNNNTSP